jgi:hypothetical protein
MATESTGRANLAEWQIRSFNDALTRSELRSQLFNNVLNDKDTGEAAQKYLSYGTNLWHYPILIFARDIQIATFAKREYKIMFGRGNNKIDTVVPLLPLKRLIELEDEEVKELKKTLGISSKPPQG